MAAPGITKEELSLIKSYLILVFIRKVFERDIRLMSECGVFKTPQLYSEVIVNGDKQASLLLSEVKREFKVRQIRVITIEQNERGVEATYAYRGYTGDMNILWPTFRREMFIRMRAYLGLSSMPRSKQTVSSIT